MREICTSGSTRGGAMLNPPPTLPVPLGFEPLLGLVAGKTIWQSAVSPASL